MPLDHYPTVAQGQTTVPYVRSNLSEEGRVGGVTENVAHALDGIEDPPVFEFYRRGRAERSRAIVQKKNAYMYLQRRNLVHIRVGCETNCSSLIFFGRVCILSRLHGIYCF